MSNRASQLIVLCEDKLHEVFVRRFLRKWGVANRLVRILDYPEGLGCGAAFVLANFPEQLKAIRSRSAVTILIVVIDADNKTVDQRTAELNKSLLDASQQAVDDDENVCLVIPKWSIDTWLAYLHGDDVNENQTYKTKSRFRKQESETHPLIDTLAETCKHRETMKTPPDSLAKACIQFDKIRTILTGI